MIYNFYLKISEMIIEGAFKLLEKILEYLIRNTGRVSSPQKHRFFSEIIRIRKYVIPYIKLTHNWIIDHWRSKIFSDMISIKLLIWEKHIAGVVKKKDCKKDDMLGAIDDLVEEYTKEWIVAWIPNSVIDKFNGWHKEHATILIQGIQDICDWRAFTSKKEKINAILYMHLNLLVITRIDAEKTLWELNWELSGIEYAWFTLL